MKTELPTAQAQAFHERIWPMTSFLFRCRKRLAVLGFDPKSELYQAVEDAYDALRSLHPELHYQSIKSGVGRPEKE